MKKNKLNQSLNQYAKYVLMIFCSIYILAGCIDNEYDIEKLSKKVTIDPKYNITIGSINIHLDELLNSFDTSNIHKYNDGSMYLIYQQDVLAYRGDEKIVIPAQVDLLFPSFLLPDYDGNGRSSLSQNKDLPVVFSGDPNKPSNKQQVDSLLIKQMNFHISGNSSYNTPGTLTIEFPNLLKNGQTYKEEINIPANSNLDIITENKATDYLAKFNTVVNDTSYMPIILTFAVSGGTPNTPVGAGVLNISFKINLLTYKVMYGYVGQYDLIDSRDSLDMSFFNRSLAKNIEWGEPELRIITNNSFGIPVRFNIKDMYAVSEQYGTTFNAMPGNSANPKDINYPTVVYASKADTIRYNRTNSPDLFNALDKSPKSLVYNINALANPLGTSTKNIVLDTSTIKCKLEYELPIYFQSSGFGMQDTMDFDLLSNSGNKLKSMVFRILAQNEMPIDFRLQIYFADSLANVIDSVFNKPTDDNTIVKGATVGPDGKITGATSGDPKDITFDAAQLSTMLNTKKLIYKVSLATSGYVKGEPHYVRFYDSYNLKLTFACQFQPIITF